LYWKANINIVGVSLKVAALYNKYLHLIL